MLGVNLLDEGFDGLRIGDVERDPAGAPAGGGDVGDGPLDRLRIASADSNAGAFRRQPQRDGPPDPLAAAGDNRHLIRKE